MLKRLENAGFPGRFFTPFIGGLSVALSMFKIKNQKSFSTERIADLYLAELTKYDVGGGVGEPFLDDFLRKRNIYADIEKLNGAIELLISNGLIEKDKTQGFSIFTYVPGATFESMQGPMTAVPKCHITFKGNHFAKGGQELDEKGKTARTEASKKNTDRWISAGISFGVAVVVMFIKWYFIDKK